MLHQLCTGWVPGYNEGQVPLIYLVSTVERVRDSATPFVFSDGHGIASVTDWYDDLVALSEVDWTAAYARLWKDTVDDMDRQRRKQAEFLIHRLCSWDLITEIAVLNDTARQRVEQILGGFDPSVRRGIAVKSDWYY